MIHQPLSPDGVHTRISSSLRLFVLCLVRSDLFVIHHCLFIFSKNSFLYLDKCHNSVFNTLITHLQYKSIEEMAESELKNLQKTLCQMFICIYIDIVTYKAIIMFKLSISLLKTLWEKEKLLVTSNFSFSQSVFYPFQEFSAIFVKSKIVACELF